MRGMSFCRGRLQYFLQRKYISRSVVQQASDVSDSEYELQEREALEREIRKLQDVSNLRSRNKAIHQGKPLADFKRIAKNYTSKDERAAYRRMYARWGSRSGLDASKLWPSKEELQEMVDIEENWEPSFQELVDKVKAKRKAEVEEEQKRLATIDKNLSKMDDMIEKFLQKQQKTQETDKQREIRERELLGDFRETFGYSVSANHPRFKEFRNQRLEEERLAKRQAKKDTMKEKKEERFKQMVESQEKGE